MTENNKEGFIKGFIIEQENVVTVPAHYGVKMKVFNEQVRRMYYGLIVRSDKTSTIDEFFSDLNNEQRSKVFAFAAAYNVMKSTVRPSIPYEEDDGAFDDEGSDD